MVGAALLLGAAFVVGSFIFRDRPTERSVDDAVEAFRASTTVVEPTSFAQPDPGVYEAVGAGGEAISTPPMEQTDSDTMPVTVAPTKDGCWTWRIDYNSAHWHEYDFCPEGDGLILEGQRNFQSWDLGVDTITNMSTTTCDPPAAILVAGAEPGDAEQHRCTGVNTAAPGDSLAEGPSTMIGVETLVIGGEEVEAVHQRRATTMTGAQRGTIDEDWWLEPTHRPAIAGGPRLRPAHRFGHRRDRLHRERLVAAHLAGAPLDEHDPGRRHLRRRGRRRRRCRHGRGDPSSASAAHGCWSWTDGAGAEPPPAAAG